jgi:ComF family protein
MLWRNAARGTLGGVPISILAPSLCWGCGAASGGHSLCRSCRGALRWAEGEAEPVCGVPAWAPVSYEGPARALVRALKFRGARGLAGELAAAIAAGAPAGLLEGALVPVALSRGRGRERGYNQAAELARALSVRTGLPVHELLVREHGGARQMGRGRGARLAQAPRFRAGRLAPPRAVLVDDVITTGATLAACANALRGAGAREVVAVAYARTPGR